MDNGHINAQCHEGMEHSPDAKMMASGSRSIQTSKEAAIRNASGA